MTLYEEGFSDGERQAFNDRRDHIMRAHPRVGDNEYMRGWHDGYSPRSVTWALRGTETSSVWWAEFKEEAAEA